MYNKLLFLLFFSAIGLISSFSFAFASAKAPVFIEVLSTSNCRFDPEYQEGIKKLLQEDDMIFLLNCRTDQKGNDQLPDKFYQKICTERMGAFFRSLDLFTVSTPMIIVDGQLSANNKDIKAAINAGRSLFKIENIKVEKKDDVLNISFPESESAKSGHNKIYLFTYAPTIDEILNVADVDLELTEEIKEKIKNNQSVPFVTKTREQPLMIRPVIGFEEIGTWDGKRLEMTFPLQEANTFLAHDQDEVSYMVIVQRENIGGAVLAAGEYRSPKEIAWMTSRPVDINKDLIQATFK